MPGLTVIIPAYNADEWLGDTVGSCLAVPEVELVIVVDDGSNNPQQHIIESTIGQSDLARVRCIRKDNGGGASARNAGVDVLLENPEARWAVLLDHDDQLAPGIAESAKIGEKTGAAIIVSDRIEFRDDGWEERKTRDRSIPAGQPIDPGLVHRPLTVWTATGLLVHRRVFEHGARFDPQLPIDDDIDFIRQAGRIGPMVCSNAIGLRRRHFIDGDNLSGPKTLKQRVDDLMLLYERWYDPAHDDGWRESFRWLLNQLLKRRITGEPERRVRDLFRRHNWAMPLRMRWRIVRNAVLARVAG